MTKDPERRKAQCLAAQQRYEQTEKGKAAHARYNATAKGRAAQRRWQRKRIRIGNRLIGMAANQEEARIINRHIKERVSAFTRQQSRTQAQSVPPRAVPPQAELRAD